MVPLTEAQELLTVRRVGEYTPTNGTPGRQYFRNDASASTGGVTLGLTVGDLDADCGADVGGGDGNDGFGSDVQAANDNHAITGAASNTLFTRTLNRVVIRST
jgi:hypothetical protein